MADKVIDPFINVEDKKLPETVDWGQQNLDNIGSLSAGGGTSSFKFDQASGLWLGAERFSDAPFSVDMEGNVIANSIKLASFSSTSASAGLNQNFTSTSQENVTDSSITFTLNKQSLIMILINVHGYLYQGGAGDWAGNGLIRLISDDAEISRSRVVFGASSISGEQAGAVQLSPGGSHYVSSYVAGEHTIKLTGACDSTTGTAYFRLYSYRMSIVSLGTI